MITSTATRRTRRARRLLPTAAATLALAATGLVASPAPTAQAATDWSWFQAGTNWAGHEFADPDVLKVGNTYYAYATNTGGTYVPVMHSTDMVNWYARDRYVPPKTSPVTGKPIINSSDWWFNDALPDVAKWADRSRCSATSPTKYCVNAWAPSVERMNDGRYVMAYVVQKSYNLRKQCVSFATSSSPEGPFWDYTNEPILCSSDPGGTIDPDLFRDPRSGRLFVMFKNEGNAATYSPTRIWTVPVREDAKFTSNADTIDRRYAPQNVLTTTNGTWEGTLIENPSMVYYSGRHYLFYSGNYWSTANYATGEAICSSANGPCKKQFNGAKLMGSDPSQYIWGPGGASGFLDPNGRLRLMYAAWNSSVTRVDTANHIGRIWHIATMTTPDSVGAVRVQTRK